MEENTNENKPVAEVMPEPEKEETEAVVQPVETEVPAEEKPAEPIKEEPQKIVVDFDYDKLADAIVKAQKRYDEEKMGTKDKPQRDISLNNIAYVFANIIAFAEIIFAVLIMMAAIIAGKQMQWTDTYIKIGNIVAFILYGLFFIIVCLVAGWTERIAVKIKNEPDRNYAVSVFSSLAAFAGFAVAGISLLLMAGRG